MIAMTENVNNQKKSPSAFFQKVKSYLAYFYEHFVKFPTYILTHPIKGYDYFKREKRGKMSVAITFMILLILVQILQFQYSGFVVSQNNPNDLKTFKEISLVVLPIVLITVSNWSITTLFDGKGKMKEIFMMLCYSLFPLIVTKALGLVLSNFITNAEVGFYNLLLGLGTFLMGYMIFFGLISIHEFGVLKNVASILGTFIALSVILFVVLLAFDLYQQVYSFIYTLYKEISLRYM